jgi:signal transduction histidine kinase
MSESNATDSSEQSGIVSSKPLDSSDSTLPKESPYLTLPLHVKKLQASLNQVPEPKSRHAPRWLRPFFSLRVQLTSIYSLLLLLMVAISVLLTRHQTSFLSVLFAVAVVVVVGTALTWVVTTVLLRPLWRVTDAAQAIAIGDLEQRGRLPLRLPPQDEIDRLAGSLNEMATKLEYAQEMQHASEERFRRFFSDASHQLRTPLTSIRGFTELLMRGAKDDTEISKHILIRMKDENERMTHLVNDLLTIARLDDQHRLKLKYIDLIELAIESIEQTRTHAKDDRQIVLDIGTNARLGLQADHERIKQLLFILLDNALKYGRPSLEGKIILKLDKQDAQVVILVKDNGEGIAPEDLEHIFDAFYRGRHRRATTPSVGAGLGLTIASTIARVHNGTISVCSSAEQGTEFKVMLPSAD